MEQATSPRHSGQDRLPICVTMSPFVYWGSWAIGTALAEDFLTHGNTSHWSRLLKNTRLDVEAAELLDDGRALWGAEALDVHLGDGEVRSPSAADASLE